MSLVRGGPHLRRLAQIQYDKAHGEEGHTGSLTFEATGARAETGGVGYQPDARKARNRPSPRLWEAPALTLTWDSRLSD